MNKDYIGISESCRPSDIVEETKTLNFWTWIIGGLLFLACLTMLIKFSIKGPPEYSKDFTLYMETSIGMFEFHPRYETSQRMLKLTNRFDIINFSIKKN